MAKFFESSEYVKDMVRDEFSNSGLEVYGLNLKVISTTKGKDIVSVSKANATTEFLTKQDQIIMVVVYEKALELIDTDEKQRRIMEGYLSSISYDSEKDKVTVDKNPANIIHRMRHKYGNDIIDLFELASLLPARIEEEEKAEKERQKQEKEARRRNNDN